MQICTLFYNPKDKAFNKKIQKLLLKRNMNCHFLDATVNDVSAYLFKDMQITTIPAFYVFFNKKGRVYQGQEKIEALLTKR